MRRRKRMLEELDQDIHDHIEMETQENIERGLSPEEARYAALRKFGNVMRAREETRAVWSSIWIEQLFQDLSYGLRALWKNPGFAMVIVVTLALGIGANTAIFSVVRAVVLAPLPYPQPDRLVIVWETRPNVKALGASYPDFLDWQRNSRSFAQMAALASRDYDLTSPGAPQHLDGMEISSSFFVTLGVKLAIGHDFTSVQDLPHGTPGVIISDRLWRDRFASSAQALGKSMLLDGAEYTVLGVLPPGFHFFADADVYTPVAQGEPLLYNDRTIHALVGIARLKPGVNIGQAEGEMSAVQGDLDRLYPAADGNLGTNIVPLKQAIVGDVGGTLLLLLGAVGTVLLIACANVANLLLVRSAARTREFAIRSALGASRARVVRQLLTESVLLAMTGGILGLLVAKLGVSLILAEFAQRLPRAESIGVNLAALFFAFGISLAVGIAFGLAPARKSSRADVQGSLKSRDRGSTRAHLRSQSGLVIIQMALTLVLLVGAGLLLRTIGDLRRVNPGFNAQHVITFKVGLSPSLTSTASDTRIAYQQLLERIRRIPGVQAADFTNIIPLGEQDNGGPFWIGPQQSTSMQDAPHALYFETGPEYLQTMEIPLLRGRFFTPADTADSEPVIVINSVLAQTYFRNQDAVGQTITVAHWRTARVIGVVGSVRHWGLGDPGTYNPSQIYISFYQLSDQWIPAFARALSVAVRTPLDVATIMPAVINVVYGTGRDQPVYGVRTMQQVVSESMSSQRLPMILLAVFAALALLLACVGIYGVISYSVSQRVQEIGVRMALGAEKRQIFQMVIGQGLRIAFVGLSIGAGAALILARLLSSFSHLLYGVGPSDPVTFVSVSLVLTSVTVLACYVPARRASRVDPMIALRCE
ncbi:MAG TPA: ABC transporter permease [Candidatus Angelobacter sp.]